MSGGRNPRPWLLYGPLLAGAFLFLLYAVLWGQGAGQMRRSIERWADDQRAAGVEVRYDGLATRGFPFFLRGAVSNVTIGEDSDWRWRAPLLFIDTGLFAPDRLVFSARDGHEIDAAGLGRWRIAAPDGRASIESDKARLWIVDVESGAGRIARVDGAESLSAERFLMTIAPAADDHETIEMSLAVADLVARNATSSIDAPSVEAMIAVRRLSAFDLGPQAWRMAGGAVELRRVVIEAEGSKLTLSGEITIDEEGRPAGVLNAEAVNPGALALALGEAGGLSKKDAEAMAATLTLAAITSGGKLKAPLVLKNGVASLAGVRLAELPPVVRSE